jgi:two-component system response regulator CpxR
MRRKGKELQRFAKLPCIETSIGLESLIGIECMATETNRQPDARRILLVDDDLALCQMLAEYLQGEGFEVITVHNGRAGVDAASDENIDAVVMDITMPVMDGFEALRQMRKNSDVPVLMLTARGDEIDRIVGLEIGADDYLPKPFNPRELVARLRAILRRTQILPADAPRLAQGQITLEPGSQSLFRNGEPVPVTATEFFIAELLLRSAGTVVSKEELTEKALGRRLSAYDRSLDTHMANLRKKLGAADDGSPLIKTVRGQGYLFVIR